MVRFWPTLYLIYKRVKKIELELCRAVRLTDSH